MIVQQHFSCFHERGPAALWSFWFHLLYVRLIGVITDVFKAGHWFTLSLGIQPLAVYCVTSVFYVFILAHICYLCT
jgi:hypothetical protein